MYFKQIQVNGLGCLSYVLGCPQAGDMIVVDPKRDVDDYLDIAREEGMRISRIIDTHVHADHVSGSHELAARTGAEICMFHETPATYEFTPLADGETLFAGNAKLQILHTPGHTPHSISILVSDLARAEDPWLILSGDLLFVGDIGRPDLAGADQLEEQVKNLFNSLYVKYAALPDGLEVYPAHGAGSLCGKGMSPKPNTTLGFERAHNPGLKFASFPSFALAMSQSFPNRPKSFSHIISTNLKGAPVLGCNFGEPALTLKDFDAAKERGAVIIDAREACAFGGCHIPGALSIGFEKQLANWVGMVVEPESEILLVVNGREEFAAMRTELWRIGYDNICGYLRGGMSSWVLAGREVSRLEQIGAREIGASKGKAVLLDVRTPAEWEQGRIPGAAHKPLSEILAACCDLPPEEEVIVYCRSGYRSNIAGSYLRTHGYAKVKSLAGGITAYAKAGLNLEK